MSALESRDYQAARDRIKRNPIIAIMAAGVVIVPQAELRTRTGHPAPGSRCRPTAPSMTPRKATRATPAYTPYPHRRLGLIAEAVLAERAAMREAVAAAMAAPGTEPESASLSSNVLEFWPLFPTTEDGCRRTGAAAR